jgi:hypothetical protein
MHNSIFIFYIESVSSKPNIASPQTRRNQLELNLVQLNKMLQAKQRFATRGPRNVIRVSARNRGRNT